MADKDFPGPCASLAPSLSRSCMMMRQQNVTIPFLALSCISPFPATNACSAIGSGARVCFADCKTSRRAFLALFRNAHHHCGCFKLNQVLFYSAEQHACSQK